MEYNRIRIDLDKFGLKKDSSWFLEPLSDIHFGHRNFNLEKYQKAVKRIKSGELQYVSPAVIPRGSESLETVNGVDILARTLPLHLCIVADPAYGKDAAKMSHLCSGDGEACYNRLKIKDCDCGSM